MSYPPPPGFTGSNPSSLPPRPPPPAKASGGASHGSSNRPPPFLGFAPRAVAAQHAGTRPIMSSGVASAASAPSTRENASASNPHAYPPSYPQSGAPHHPTNAGQETGYMQAPHIRNPFAPPGSSAGASSYVTQTYDPEMEAQIAQWQSAYMPKDARGGMNVSIGPRSAHDALSSADLQDAASADTGVASVVTGADGQRKTVVRSGGGQTWQDSSLLEWDPTHFRIFVGNLAGEVTDDSLFKAFSKYSSVQKARVIRDKRSTKSKGYGFVSFADGDDYFQAAREMQGKYIGSHPVLIKKSTTEIKAVTSKDRNAGKKGKGQNGRGGEGGGGGYAYTGAGVQKKQKTKGGLKILG